MSVYFDNAATTMLDPRVLEAMLPYLKEHYGNASSIHSLGRDARAAIEKSRKTIAKMLNVSPGEIFFTSCATESNNTAIRSTVKSFQIKHILTTRLEHHCVLNTCEAIHNSGIAIVHYVDIDENGRIKLEHLKALLSKIPDKCLVSIMHANNEIGTINPIEEIGLLCKNYGAIFHSDTVQTIGYYPLDFGALNLHMASGSAHKFHGPKGNGFLYVHHSIKLEPLLLGGSQERNMRAGTENVAGIVGMTKAMELAFNELDTNKKHIEGLKSEFLSLLNKELIGAQINGIVGDDSLYKIINVSFPSTPNSMLIQFNLDIAGIAVSSGSACSSGSDKGSHVLEALNIKDDKVSVRFSFSKYNTIEEVHFVINTLKELINN